jgi:hypothetical protein
VRGFFLELHGSGIVTGSEGHFLDIEGILQERIENLNQVLDGWDLLHHHKAALRIGFCKRRIEYDAGTRIEGRTILDALSFIYL